MGQFAGVIIQVVALAATIGLQIALAPKGVNEEGPRLDNLRTTASTYGSNIPTGYGRIRVGGNCIWATDMVEVRSKRKTGGKGGGSGSVTEYKYFGNFAIALAEGPAKCITRIWLDKKICWDVTGASTGFFKYPGAALREYLGSETQLPDPTIQADKGTATTPGHRGLVYVVFENLPLADFGNRLPSVEAEVDFSTTETSTESSVTGGVAGEANGVAVIPGSRQLIYATRGQTSKPTMAPQISRINMDTNTVEAQKLGTADGLGNFTFLYEDEFPTFDGINPTDMFSTDNGKLYLVGQRGDNGGNPFFLLLQLNPWTLDFIKLEESFDALGGRGIGGATGGGGHQTFAMQTVEGVHNFILIAFSTPYLPPDQTYLALYDADRDAFRRIKTLGEAGGSVSSRIAATVHTKNGLLFGVGQNDSATGTGGGRRASLWGMQVSLVQVDTQTNLIVGQALGAVNFLYGFLYEALIEFLGSGFDFSIEETDLTQFDVHDPKHIVYLEGETSLLILGSTGALDGKFKFVKLSINDDGTFTQTAARTLDETGDANLVPSTDVRTQYLCKNSPTNGYHWYRGATGDIVALHTTDLTTEVKESPAVTSAVGPMWDRDGLQGWYADQTNTPTLIKYDRCPEVPEPLESVLEAIETRGGELSSSDLSYDAGILAQTLRGYVSAGRQSIRKLLEPLVLPFNFDIVESGNVLKHVSRGGSVVRTIATDDLGSQPAKGAGSKGEENVIITDRSQEFEIPVSMDLTYFDKDRDQQEGTQTDRRHLNPSQTQSGRDHVSVRAPILMSADEAAQAIEKALYNVWNSRIKYEFSVGPKHMDLDPTDVVAVSSGSRTFGTRFSRMEVGEGFTTKVDAFSEDAEIYNSTAVGAVVPVTSQLVTLPGATEPLVLDIPLLQDQDDGQQILSGVYVNFGAQTASWKGAIIERTIRGGGGFERFSATKNDGGAPWGYLVNDIAPLAKHPDPTAPDPTGTEVEYPSEIEAWDRTTSFQAYIVQDNDKLSSVSELGALKGLNTAVIGNGTTCEILSVVDITDDGDNLFTFTTLLRGRRGTEEAAVAGHSRGGILTFVDSDWTNREGIEVNRIGDTDTYRAISTRQVREDGAIRSFVHNAVDMLPYPVAHPRVDNPHDGSARGDLTLSWTYRGRLGAEFDLADGTGTTSVDMFVPAGESIFQFEVDIMEKATPTTVSSTVSSDGTNPEVTVGLAAITTAGYTDGDPVRFRIYQKSGVAGRGLPREIVI